MRNQRQLNEALHDAAEALRAVAEATCERRDCDDEGEDERRRLRHCLRELRELGDSLRDAVKALCGTVEDECAKEPCDDDDAPCASAHAPLPPYPPYPSFAPYPPYPPYPPIVVVGGSGGCCCNCHGAAMPAMAAAPASAASVSPATPATHSAGTQATSAASIFRPAAAAATIAGGFPDPASITDVESLLDTAESAAALVRRTIGEQPAPGGD